MISGSHGYQMTDSLQSPKISNTCTCNFIVLVTNIIAFIDTDILSVESKQLNALSS